MFDNFKRGLGSKMMPGPWWCSGCGNIAGESFLERICWLVYHMDVCFNTWGGIIFNGLFFAKSNPWTGFI